jgi:hypothetical protein
VVREGPQYAHVHDEPGWPFDQWPTRPSEMRFSEATSLASTIGSRLDHQADSCNLHDSFGHGCGHRTRYERVMRVRVFLGKFATAWESSLPTDGILSSARPTCVEFEYTGV